MYKAPWGRVPRGLSLVWGMVRKGFPESVAFHQTPKVRRNESFISRYWVLQKGPLHGGVTQPPSHSRGDCSRCAGQVGGGKKEAPRESALAVMSEGRSWGS